MKLSKIVKNILLDVSKEMKKKDNLTIIRMDILNPIIKEIIDELNPYFIKFIISLIIFILFLLLTIILNIKVILKN